MTNATVPISFKRRKWVLPDPASLPESGVIARLATSLGLPPLIATLLAARGLTDTAEATAFLDPQFRTIHDPSLLPNMERAVERIVRAVKAGEKIVIFGDYDVDGITGTAMLWHLLRTAGGDAANLATYIPHRVEEGYGLSTQAIGGLIDEGAKLIISVDCGGSACAPIELARSRGVDLIVTDHHELPAELPPAYAIIHPRLPGSAYPNPELCGAGVAYKLAWALASRFCGGGKVNATYRNLLIEFVALVALATIADVVPLTGENRTLVKYGLQQLPRSTLTGVRALLAAAGYTQRAVDCTAVGFGLAPRLNAAGRMDHADLAVELLTSADQARADEIAAYLETQNRDRQAMEKKMFADAQAQIASWLDSGQPLPHVIVVNSEDHHAGVVGIVASRLVETFNRPAFVLACDENDCHGSARSIPGFAVHEAIEHCRSLLTSGGGHAMAGGVKFPRQNLDAFRDQLNAYARSVLAPDAFIPTLAIDAILTLSDLSLSTVQRLAQFEPFGRGNPHPRFLLERMRLAAPPRRVGSTGSHLQLQLSQNGTLARAIAFKAGALAPALHVGFDLDLVVEPRLDHYNGTPRLDLVVCDIARSDGRPFDPLPEPAAKPA